jgi:hypothetical protein
LNWSSCVSQMSLRVSQNSVRLSFRSGSQILSPLLLSLLCIVLHMVYPPYIIIYSMVLNTTSTFPQPSILLQEFGCPIYIVSCGTRKKIVSSVNFSPNVPYHWSSWSKLRSTVQKDCTSSIQPQPKMVNSRLLTDIVQNPKSDTICEAITWGAN